MPLSQAPARPTRRPRRPRNTLSSFLLALTMHALLFAALWFAVQWHTVSDSPAQAELWSLPPPTSVVVPPTPPTPTPPPPPPVVSNEPQVENPEIITKQEKAKPIPEPTPPPPEPVKPPPEPVKPPPEPPKEPPKPQPKPPEPPPPPPKEQPKEPPKKPPEPPKPDLRAQREAEKLRQAEIERALAAADSATGSATGSPGGTQAGSGAGGHGDPGYQGRIKGCIKPNIVFDPSGAPPDTEAEFVVELLPDGSQAGPPKMTKPSGLPAYDAAVERAIRKCDPFPRPSDGSVPRSMRLTFRPNE